MKYSFLNKLHDNEGDEIDNGLFIFVGDNTIIKFQDSVELEQFANRILQSLPEIREGN